MNDRDIQRSITAFWDTVAPAYDSPENVAAAGSADYDRWRQALAQLLPSAPARVLDVGTGTGFLAGIAAQLGHRVTAIDLSAGMLDAARAADSTAGVTFLLGDAVAPAFPRASFDAVISRSVLWTLREPDRAIANWYQLLAPAGRIIAFYGLSPTTGSEPADAGDEPSLFELHYTPETRSQLPAMHLFSHDPLLQAATDAGFARVSTIAIDSLQGWEKPRPAQTFPTRSSRIGLPSHRRPQTHRHATRPSWSPGQGLSGRVRSSMLCPLGSWKYIPRPPLSW